VRARTADYLRFNAEDWGQLRGGRRSTPRRSIARSFAELGAAPLGDLLDIGTGTAVC
jgi:hypothetical protein